MASLLPSLLCRGHAVPRDHAVPRGAIVTASILDRLDAVAERGPGRWIARCPAHDDRNPSLSIRETDDGTTLVRCWAGCDAIDIVSAVGLTLADLFPDREQQHRRPPTDRRLRLAPADALRILRRESLVIAVASADLARGIFLSHDDHARLLTAVARVADLSEVSR